MRKILNHRVTRAIARPLLLLCLLLWHAPPAAAFTPPRRPARTQTPDAAQRAKIDARMKQETGKLGNWETRGRKGQRDVEALADAQLAGIYARGPKRNRAFSGILPWQRSLRDVNLSNGNLFKSFTDIQVSPAQGAGLAWQRTYNSNDDRPGAFGVGWTHAYDIRMEEASPTEENNQNQAVGVDRVARTDFFGGKHHYKRDADGLYSPPPYLFDELDSNYDTFLVNGPAEVLSDTQRGMDGSVKHFVKDGTSTERHCDWIEDRHGNRTTLEYGLSVSIGGVTRDLLTKVTDPSGRWLTVTWTNLGTQQSPVYRVTQVQGPFDANNSTAPYTVQYQYNAAFNLWKVVQDPAGLNRVTTFTYTFWTDGQGGSEAGLLASISDPLGHTVSYEYGLMAITDSLWVTKVTEPGSGGNHVWTISGSYHNQWYPVLGQANSNAGLAVGVYSDAQLRKKFYDPNGEYLYLHWTEYDSANNVTRTVRVSQFRAESGGTWQTDGSRAETMTYGPHGNLLTHSFDGFANSTSTTTYYDASKYFQKASVEDAAGNVSQFDYFDKFDSSPGNRGNVKWVRDARYATTGKQFTYGYTSWGAKAWEINQNDVLTEFFYEDTWKNLTKVVQDSGTGKLNRTTTVAYDVASRVASSTDPKLQSSSFQYNGVGQPTQASLPGETVSYVYGLNGRTEEVTDGRGTTELSYETGNDRVASVEDPVTGLVSYTYGLSGERLTMTLPGGQDSWTYEYGIRGAVDPMPKDEADSVSHPLERITDEDGRRVDYWLDGYGELKRAWSNQTFQGGALVTYQKAEYRRELDANGSYTRGNLKQLKNTWHSKDGQGQWQSSTLVQNDYTYSANGNRLTNAISNSGGLVRTEEYDYDQLSRLTDVDYGDGEVQVYTFDPMGNRLSKSVNGTPESYTYNAANMLLTRGANNYSNDANGNTLSGGGRTMDWDGQNRMVECAFGGVTTEHEYGADGLRRRTTKGTEVTDTILDGQGAVRTLVNSVVDRTYLHGARGPEYERVGANAPVWYLYDGLGSVLGTVNASGNLVSTRKYDVYGAVRGSSGPSGTKHKFVGGLGHPSEDDTGLVYMRARWMDPLTGSFASEDPAKDGVNWYQYAAGRPTQAVDPKGTSVLDDAIRALTDFANQKGEEVGVIGGPGDIWILFGLMTSLFAIAHLTLAADWTIRYYFLKIASETALDPVVRATAAKMAVTAATKSHKNLAGAAIYLLTGHSLMIMGQMMNDQWMLDK